MDNWNKLEYDKKIFFAEIVSLCPHQNCETVRLSFICYDHYQKIMLKYLLKKEDHTKLSVGAN